MCTKPSPRPKRARRGRRKPSPSSPPAPYIKPARYLPVPIPDQWLENVATAAAAGFGRLHHELAALLTIYNDKSLRRAIPERLLAHMPQLAALHAAIGD